MICNLVAMTFVGSFTEIPQFVMVQQKTWPPMIILVFELAETSKIVSETTGPNDAFKYLYKDIQSCYVVLTGFLNIKMGLNVKMSKKTLLNLTSFVIIILLLHAEMKVFL